MTAHTENVPCVCGSAECTIPYGLCHCGCGGKTTIAKRNKKATGVRKGVPQIILNGHNGGGKRKIFLPSGLCICRDILCTIPRGRCHCGCGLETTISNRTDVKSGRIIGEPMRFIEGHSGRIIPQIEEARPFKIGGVYCRLISLTQGLYAIVWESDYRWLMQWKWCAERRPDSGTFYAVRNSPTENGKKYPIKMHRLILGLDYGDVGEVDHIDSLDTLDNRRANLRLADDCQQSCNQRRRSRNTSGYKGVSWDNTKGKWLAQITFRGEHHFLGRFATKELAYAAYCKAAVEIHGEFARLS